MHCARCVLSADDTRYLHKDHLGSVDVITNESGGVVQRLSYDAFGKRRNATAWAGAPGAADWTNIAAITHRGFTFHEELDNLDLVHMNGRVYDPNIGRFISADPFVQAPLMSQSLNRYSYVMNNPLSMTDPSGYSWLSRALRGVGGFIKRYWREIVAAVVAYVTYGAASTWAAGWAGTGSATAGAVAGAAAGAAYAATATALYGGSIGDVLTYGALGGVLGGIAGWANVQFAQPTPLAGISGGAAAGTPSGSPPMTAPTGAISLTGGAVTEAFNSSRAWFSGLWGGGGLHYRGRSTEETQSNAAETRLMGVNAAAAWLRSQGLINYVPTYSDTWRYKTPTGLYGGCKGDDYTCGGNKTLVEGVTDLNTRAVSIYRGAITILTAGYGYRAGRHGGSGPFTIDQSWFHSSYEKAIFTLAHEGYHNVYGDEPRDLDYESYANTAAWEAVLQYRRNRGE